MTERWIYQERRGDRIREYLHGDYYVQYNKGAGTFIAGWACYCKDSTMKNWGSPISEKEAKTLIPDIDVLKRQALEKLNTELDQQNQEQQQGSEDLAKLLTEIALSKASESELEAELTRRRTHNQKKTDVS
jgi:hypothetical protein